MARGPKTARRHWKRLGPQPKLLTAGERKVVYKLSEMADSMNIQLGVMPADEQHNQAIKGFLIQAEECASILKVQMAPRSYRDQFPTNYRSHFPSHKRQYLPDILMGSMSQASQSFVCVNGDMHALPSRCRSSAAALRSSLNVVAAELSRFVCNQFLPDLPTELRVGKKELKAALREFDEAWVSFEKEYVTAAIQIEAQSRAPLVEAISFEKVVGAMSNDQEAPKLQLFLACLSNLTAKVQLRHRRSDDTLNYAVLMSASFLLQEHHNRVTSVLANGVTKSFTAVRAYLQTIEPCIDHVHPHLHLNIELVEILNCLNRSFKFFEQWGQPGPVNSVLNSAVARTEQVMRMIPRFKEMCEQCDPDMFLILPRILLLCCLRDLTALQDILKKFLPSNLHHVDEEEYFDKSEEREQSHAWSTQNRKFDALSAKLCSTMRMLRGLLAHQNSEDLSHDQEDFMFDLLLQRAILGMSEGEHGLYDCIEPKSRNAASSTVNGFMLELEGWSLELQRHCPKDWNEFIAVLLSCVDLGLVCRRPN